MYHGRETILRSGHTPVAAKADADIARDREAVEDAVMYLKILPDVHPHLIDSEFGRLLSAIGVLRDQASRRVAGVVHFSPAVWQTINALEQEVREAYCADETQDVRPCEQRIQKLRRDLAGMLNTCSSPHALL